MFGVLCFFGKSLGLYFFFVLSLGFSLLSFLAFSFLANIFF
jgi:hypothetical protein